MLVHKETAVPKNSKLKLINISLLSMSFKSIDISSELLYIENIIRSAENGKIAERVAKLKTIVKSKMILYRSNPWGSKSRYVGYDGLNS